MLELELHIMLSLIFAQDGGTLRTSLFLQVFCLEQIFSDNKSLHLSLASSVLEQDLIILEL